MVFYEVHICFFWEGKLQVSYLYNFFPPPLAAPHTGNIPQPHPNPTTTSLEHLYDLSLTLFSSYLR